MQAKYEIAFTFEKIDRKVLTSVKEYDIIKTLQMKRRKK